MALPYRSPLNDLFSRAGASIAATEDGVFTAFAGKGLIVPVDEDVVAIDASETIGMPRDMAADVQHVLPRAAVVATVGLGQPFQAVGDDREMIAEITAETVIARGIDVAEGISITS